MVEASGNGQIRELHDDAHMAAHAAHQREHEIVAESHKRNHEFAFEAHEKEHAKLAAEVKESAQRLAEELKETARELSLNVRETAERLAETLRTTADTHWKNHEQKHADDIRALDKAEIAVSKRLDGMNEFRAQLKDQAATFMTREQAVQTHRSMDEKVALIQKWIDGQVGRSVGMAPMMGIGFGVITAVIAAIAVAFFTGR